MDRVTIQFARAARNADVAIFYFAGHAMQFNGINYLFPVDATLSDEEALRRMFRVDEISADLQKAKNLKSLFLIPAVTELEEGLKRWNRSNRKRGLSRTVSQRWKLRAE